MTRSGIFAGGFGSLSGIVRYAAALSAVVRRPRPAITDANGLKMDLFSVPLARATRGHLVWRIRDLVAPLDMLLQTNRPIPMRARFCRDGDAGCEASC